jgi:anti-anti-sigma regulatory factor
MAQPLHSVREQSVNRRKMTLKIQRASQGHSTTIRLIGRMRAEHLDELEKQIRESGPAITLDLEEVTLVDVEIVRFLGTSEARGATLRHCSPYIRDWIGKERD